MTLIAFPWEYDHWGMPKAAIVGQQWGRRDLTRTPPSPILLSSRRSFSFQVATEDQGETDRYWSAIVGNGGQESECGWCKDKWGISWQITPIALTKAFTSPDRQAAKRAFNAMMTMRKIDIAAIEAAFRG